MPDDITVPDEVAVPAIIDRAAAAEILGVFGTNLLKLKGCPRPLQDRGIPGFDVSKPALFPRAEIEALAAERAARK